MKWFQQINEKQLYEWRHWLHQHPELGFEEVETSQYIEQELLKMPNIEVIRPTKTSVLGILKGTKTGSGKVIALRADIDALPIQEEAELSFRSEKDGKMHACGHDTHAAMLLSAAAVLAEMTDQFAGTIKFIFQHAEEITPGGAQEILATGHLDDVDIFYGSHVMTPMTKGQVLTRPGSLMAAQNSFHLTIQGRGSHGSKPESSIDPIMVGADIVMNLNQIVSRNIGPLDNVVISIGRFVSCDFFIVIPDKAYIEGTIRTNTPEMRELVGKRVKTVIDHICKAHDAEYSLEYVHGYPALINNADVAALVQQVAEEILPAGSFTEATPAMGSEDFSYYTEKAPSAYAFIGGGDATDGCEFVNHHPKFQVDESAMLTGVKMYIGFALKSLDI